MEPTLPRKPARKVLVTGASGFIGRHVVRAFAREGARVTAFGRGPLPGELEAMVSVWREGAITLSRLETHGEQPDVIVHCAGGGSVGKAQLQPLVDFESTVATTAAVLEFARQAAPHARIIYPSSGAVYGAALSLPLAESSPLLPVSVYGTHKVLAEQLCGLAARQFGLSVAVMRLFSVYGPGLRKQLLWDACTKLRGKQNTFSGTGLETRDWVHVDDVVAALLLAVEHASPKVPVVNVGAGRAVTTQQLLERLFHVAGSSATPVFDGVARSGDPAHYQADISSISAWGWRPERSLEEGLTEYVRWFEGASG